MNRRKALKTIAGAGTLGVLFGCASLPSIQEGSEEPLAILPVGSVPVPIQLPHFPSRLHAFIWRNWQLVPATRLAKVLNTTKSNVVRMGREMGLEGPPRITSDQQRRSYITVIRRNWHLLPYDQLLELLDWSAEKMHSTLRHDDGLFWKLGSLKPKCERITFSPENETVRARSREIASQLTHDFPDGTGGLDEPLFQFVADLSASPADGGKKPRASHFSPRFCYSYFSLYGDPLLDGAADPYPDGYLARLANSGVDGVWLHIVLSKLAPFPWDAKESEHHEQRLKNLRALAKRAGEHGIKVYLYLNEPRSLSLDFFKQRPGLKGLDATNAWEAGTATLCTSVPEVQRYLRDAITNVCNAVPDLGGFFSITASENLTNCWSHHGGSKCPRCSKRSPAEVIAELNTLYRDGIRNAGTKSELIVWDWGWNDSWAESIINALPQDVSFMSVSEWSLPLNRGGVKVAVGEYSISAVGPGPRATRHWELARKHGLKTVAKIQAGNTWELSATPYIPAIESVARHAANLRDANVDGLMLGWSLGGYPSPNLEVVAELGASNETTPEAAMTIVAERRFGRQVSSAVVRAWCEFSTAFSEFPFGGGIYLLPVQSGPSNLFWSEPTGYAAGAVGLPYDDLKGWRGEYPDEIFIGQLEKVASGFEAALVHLQDSIKAISNSEPAHRLSLKQELSVAETAAIHFRSATNQARFVQARNILTAVTNREDAIRQIDLLERLLKDELQLARRLHSLQSCDSRIGFEASNHYYYVPIDLAEKVINCRHLLQTWIPKSRAKWSGAA